MLSEPGIGNGRHFDRVLMMRRPSFLMAAVLGILVASAVAALSLQTRALSSIEHWSGDWRSALLADRAPSQHQRVAVVLVDDDTLFGLPYRSPVDRALLARLVAVIDAAGASVVGLDFLFDQSTEPSKDTQLLEQLRRTKAKVVLGSVDERITLRPERRAYLAKFLGEAGAASGYLNLRYEIDGVVRAEAEPDPAANGGSSGFAAAIAKAAGASLQGASRRIAWLGKPRDDAETFLVVPAGSLLAAAPDTTSDEGQRRLARMLLTQLKDRVVLIGGDLPEQSDRHLTPLSKLGGEPMPGVLIHAHIAAQLIDGRTLHDVAPSLEIVGIVLLSIAGTLTGWRFHRSATATGSAPLLLLVALDTIIFTQLRTIVPFAAVALAWLGGVVCGRAMRWLQEGRFPGGRIRSEGTHG